MPVYEGTNFTTVIHKDWRADLSPYDFKPDYVCSYGCNGFVVPGQLKDGGWVFQGSLRGSGGTAR